MICYVCGRHNEPGEPRCHTCASHLVDLSTFPLPDAVRLHQTGVLAERFGSAITELLVVARPDDEPGGESLTATDFGEPEADADAHPPVGFDPTVSREPVDPTVERTVDPEPAMAFVGLDDARPPGDPAPAGMGAVATVDPGAVSFTALQDAAAAAGPDPRERLRVRLPRPRLPRLDDDSNAVRTGILVLVVVLGLGYLGLRANTRDRTEPPSLSLGEGSDTTQPAGSALDEDELVDRLAAATFTVRADGCGVTREGYAVAIADTRLVTTRSLVAADPTPTLTGPDGPVEGEVVGWLPGPDLAVIEVEDPVTASSPLSRRAPVENATVVVLGPDGTPTVASVERLVAGWSGSAHGFSVTGTDLSQLEGSAVLGQNGRVVGLVSRTLREGEPHLAVSSVALDQVLADAVDSGLVTPDCTDGGRSAPAAERWGDPAFGSTDLDEGADPVLDDLNQRCVDGDLRSCDDLSLVAPALSTYLSTAETCGGQVDAAANDLGCTWLFDRIAIDPEIDRQVGDCLVLPRRPDGWSRTVPCARPHDAEVVHLVRYEADLPVQNGRAVVSEALRNRAVDACTEPAGSMITEDYWDRVLDWAAVAPTTSGQPFSCVVYTPGVAATTPLP